MIDRQHVQVALVALGFSPSLLDGLSSRAYARADHRLAEGAIQSWTGFLTEPQYQALMQEAAPAISKFDDEQKNDRRGKKEGGKRQGSSVDPELVPLEEDKKIRLTSDGLILASGQKCNATVIYIIPGLRQQA